MTVESESRSQLNNRTWDETAVDWSFWGNYGEAHTCLFKYRCVLEYLLELWTVKMYWYLIWSLTEELVLACENSCQHRKVLKTFIWQEKKKSDITTWIHAVRPGQWKEKANWKQSKCIYFSVSLVSFSYSRFRIGDGSDDKELVNHAQQWVDVPDVGATAVTPQLLWGLAGDGVTACCTLPPVTSPVCLGPLPEVKS